MASGIRRTRKEDITSFERDGVTSTLKDVKKENFSGSMLAARDSAGSSRARSQSKVQGKIVDGPQVSVSEKRISSVSLPRRLFRSSMAPILSLKRVQITQASTGQFFMFLLRVAALEAIRRVSRSRCPQIWWGLQGISLLQAPPFSWLLRWAPLRHLVEGTQSFSKPLIFLSLATAVSSAVDEIKHGSDPHVLDRILAPSGGSPSGSAGVEMQEGRQTETLNGLKLALEQAEVNLPERVDDEELENFLIAANGDEQRCVAKLQKSLNWRQTYYFLNSQELRQWSHLVSWHDCDAKSRPTLIIRLGPAYSSLPADQRPRFCQAVVSQVEFGMLHLLNDDDPRITVIMDCEGTTALGFPVHMMKSCAVLVQDNYPTRLAALFAVNLPPVVRVVANAVMQVIGSTTRKKLHLLGDVFMTALSEHLGGTDKVPVCLGGSCHCSDCMEGRRSAGVRQISYDGNLLGHVQRRYVPELEEVQNNEGDTYEEDVVSNNYQSYNSVLRVAIVVFLMLWIMITMVAGLHDPETAPT